MNLPEEDASGPTPSQLLEAELARLRRSVEGIGNVLRMDTGSEQEFLDRALDEAIAITGSRMGYIYHYDESTEQFILNSWSKTAMAQCEVMERQTIYMLSHTGLWGEAVRQRRPVIANNFDMAPMRKGLPEGHVQLKRYLTVPVIVDERIVGVVGVANKESDYDESDTQLLTVLMGAVWKSLLRWKAENDYQTLFHEMINGFAVHEILCDKDGKPVDYRFLDANPAFEKMTGLAVSSIVGKTVTEVIPSIEKRWIEIYGKVALTGEPINFESTSGELGKRFDVTAFRPSPGRFATFFFDVTARENAIADLRRSEDRLRQAEKMEALGMLSGGIAHDFNNILGAILGFSEIAMQMVGEDSPAGKNVAKIVRSGKRAKKLVQQIQTYTAASKPKTFPVRIALLVAEVADDLRATAPATIEIVAKTEGSACVVDVEPTRIHEAMLNLGMNALHAMKSGGKLEIRLMRTVVESTRTARIGQILPGAYALLEFADTGCGMDPETLRRAFDPFFTTRKVGEGSGMGLAVVQGVAQSLGCAVDAESVPGEGSVFRIWIPLSERGAQALGEGVGAAAPGRGERILVVDDEELILDFYAHALKHHGYVVELASNGTEALAKLSRDEVSYDLLLTDQTMPGMSGAELARRAMVVRPALPVLLCTGYNPDISESRAAEIGIKKILAKPMEMADLAREVREAIDTAMAGVG